MNKIFYPAYELTVENTNIPSPPSSILLTLNAVFDNASNFSSVYFLTP